MLPGSLHQDDLCIIPWSSCSRLWQWGCGSGVVAGPLRRGEALLEHDASGGQPRHERAIRPDAPACRPRSAAGGVASWDSQRRLDTDMVPAPKRRPPEEVHTRPGRKLESVQDGDAVPQLEKGMGTFNESPRSIVAIATDAEPGPEMARLKRTDAADRPREKRPVTGLTFASEPWSVGCASSGMGHETSTVNARLAPSAARVLRSGGGILMQ